MFTISRLSESSFALILGNKKLYINTPTPEKDGLCLSTSNESLKIGDIMHLGEIDIMCAFGVNAVSIIVSYKKIRLCFLGDSAYHERLRDLSALSVDILVGGDMDAKTLVSLADDVGACAVIPSRGGDGCPMAYEISKGETVSVYSIIT